MLWLTLRVSCATKNGTHGIQGRVVQKLCQDFICRPLGHGELELEPDLLQPLLVALVKYKTKARQIANSARTLRRFVHGFTVMLLYYYYYYYYYTVLQR
jgi:hypothetical protein